MPPSLLHSPYYPSLRFRTSAIAIRGSDVAKEYSWAHQIVGLHLDEREDDSVDTVGDGLDQHVAWQTDAAADCSMRPAAVLRED